MNQFSTNNGGILIHPLTFFVAIVALLTALISCLFLVLPIPNAWYLPLVAVTSILSLAGVYRLKRITTSSLETTTVDTSTSLVLEDMMEPFCIYSAEREVVIEANTAMRTLCGGKNNVHSGSELNKFVRELWEACEHTLAKNDFKGFVGQELELPIIEGAKRNLNVSIKNILSKKNAYLIQIRDVTEQKKRVKAQEKSTEYIKFIINSLPVTIFALNLKGAFVLAEGKGVERWQLNKDTPLNGQSFFQLYKDSPIAINTLERALRGESIETDLNIGDSIFNVRFSPLDNINKMHIGVIMVGIDVTEAKQAAEKLRQYTLQLEQSNKELKTFTKIAAHDLKEPLRLVSNYLQLLEMRYKSKLDESGVEYIEYAVGGAKRLHALITDLMLYNSLELDKKSFKEVDCNKVIAFMKHNLKLVIQKNEATIEVVNLSTVFGNESHLLQLFQHLISNAVKYRSEAPPNIKISVIEKETHHLFRVTDNGIGIDSEYKERIFDIFQRLENINVKAQNGTGIGLAICKKIVQLHNGKIWVESDGLGKGSCFCFTIAKKK